MNILMGNMIILVVLFRIVVVGSGKILVVVLSRGVIGILIRERLKVKGFLAKSFQLLISHMSVGVIKLHMMLIWRIHLLKVALLYMINFFLKVGILMTCKFLLNLDKMEQL